MTKSSFSHNYKQFEYTNRIYKYYVNVSTGRIEKYGLVGQGRDVNKHGKERYEISGQKKKKVLL